MSQREKRKPADVFKFLENNLYVERQGVVFTLSFIGYIICIVGILSHLGNVSMSFAGDGAQEAVTFWMVLIALIALVQLVLGLIVLCVQIKDRERVLVFSVLNTLLGLVVFGYCAITPIVLFIG
ncbi:hypothetical protein [Leucobacter luti]|uniref:hypothetical protein n=1 Tax=Leucobacter luti TaxID=340320 RepID=UPI001C68D2AD|nr:hypothetical protein [Leucobacter luti]QYM75110.1 hypothetical protein K1X41_10585 [Leucobacter luti]